MSAIKPFLLVFGFFLLFGGKVSAQFGMSHEVGIMAGPANFLTDYGERWNVQNNVRNAGLGVGLLHFVNFAYSNKCDCYAWDSYFASHFRIRNEITYLRSDLEHFGPVANGTGEGARQLQAMHGETELWEAGTLLEFHPLRIRDFTNFGYWFSPYLIAGAHFVTYKPDAYSDLGSLNNPKNVFRTFRDGGIKLHRGTTYSIVGGAGARYRLAWNHDLMFEARFHYYGNDWIDGLNIQEPQNMYNDVVFWVNVGYVYYINF